MFRFRESIHRKMLLRKLTNLQDVNLFELSILQYEK
jgi:hypothetical protein